MNFKKYDKIKCEINLLDKWESKFNLNKKQIEQLELKLITSQKPSMLNFYGINDKFMVDIQQCEKWLEKIYELKRKTQIKINET